MLKNISTHKRITIYRSDQKTFFVSPKNIFEFQSFPEIGIHERKIKKNGYFEKIQRTGNIFEKEELNSG